MKGRPEGLDRVSSAYRIASEGRDEGMVDAFRASAGLALRGGWPELAHWIYSELLRRMPAAAERPEVAALKREIGQAKIEQLLEDEPPDELDP
jgi:hypothetical protein